MSATTPCPKCKRPLSPSGVATVDDGPELPVYQCDECLVRNEVLGVKMEMALTFMLDEQGRPIDPADPEKPLSLD